ncbi:glycoside hydrolase family 6 protein [Candidatus Parcubacteria bacterium]|nr:glycoside hydrolase family 6 protein [Candidatus Parcubacteria bacterium]
MNIQSKLTIALIVCALFMTKVSSVNAAGPVEVWWPAQDIQLHGSVPFKAMLQGLSIEQYMMFWQVDNGQWNWMDNNYSDYPHKEIMVDLSGWNWKGNGPYTLNFIAVAWSGQILAQTPVRIYTDSSPKPTPTPVSIPVITTPKATPTPIATSTPTLAATLKVASSPTPTPMPLVIASTFVVAPTPAPTPLVVETPTTTPLAISTLLVQATPTPAPTTSNPMAGKKLYVNPNSDPQRWVNDHRTYDATNSALMNKIAQQPETQWFGNWNNNVYQDVKNTVATIEAQGAYPVFVAYNIPGRDCGSYSAGGSATADAYKNWIRSFADGIANHAAAVLLEPDALAGIDCLSSQDQQSRLALLTDAVKVLRAKGNISVYLDAGNPGWQSADIMTQRLKNADIAEAQGFSLNVSNFFTNSDSLAYGKLISAKVGNKHFVVETSRNGNGPTSDYQWCNPWGRALGTPPTTNTGNSLIDAYLWVRGPSGSDGQCNGGPSAGSFWPEYGLDLARNTHW